jgi:hypothetical protein
MDLFSDSDSLFCKYWVSWAQKADFEPSKKELLISSKYQIPNKGSLFYSLYDWQVIIW